MSKEIVPTNLRVRIVGNKARQALYTNKEYIGGLYHIDMGTPDDDQYWYIIPNDQETRIGTFQIQNTVTHQNLHMRSSGSGSEGEVGTSVPDISKDDQAIRLTLGEDANAGSYRFESPLGDRTFKLYCRNTWQPPTLGCIDLTQDYDDQWFSFEHEPLEFISVDYDLEHAVIRNSTPKVIFSQKEKNGTNATQTQSVEFSETTKCISTWEFAIGVELARTVEAEVGIPELAKGKVQVSGTLKTGFTKISTAETEQVWKRTVVLTCEGGKTAQCTATVVASTIEVPCTTTYKSKKTGEYMKIKGMYKGTGCSDLETATSYV